MRQTHRLSISHTDFDTWVQAWGDLGLKLIEEEIFFIPFFLRFQNSSSLEQDEAKFCWRCFTEARDADPCISASLTHTGERGTLVQCAALFNSLMRY